MKRIKDYMLLWFASKITEQTYTLTRSRIVDRILAHVDK